MTTRRTLATITALGALALVPGAAADTSTSPCTWVLNPPRCIPPTPPPPVNAPDPGKEDPDAPGVVGPAQVSPGPVILDKPNINITVGIERTVIASGRMHREVRSRKTYGGQLRLFKNGRLDVVQPLVLKRGGVSATVTGTVSDACHPEAGGRADVFWAKLVATINGVQYGTISRTVRARCTG